MKFHTKKDTSHRKTRQTGHDTQTAMFYKNLAYALNISNAIKIMQIIYKYVHKHVYSQAIHSVSV